MHRFVKYVLQTVSRGQPQAAPTVHHEEITNVSNEAGARICSLDLAITFSPCFYGLGW